MDLSLPAQYRPPWHARASCRGHDNPGLWFPATGEPTRPAKAICATCPAEADCLRWALAQDSALQGIWGGTSSGDRRRLRNASTAA